jgi:hypothetical protein
MLANVEVYFMACIVHGTDNFNNLHCMCIIRKESKGK